ncbi:Asp23/Gls24 family envelope stress response protein [Microbacterium gilvum]|uniref:Asp23/Gls24 family envelope stress response protein n=1 Tax=Microbacterium gilvum TaxID=1336204 RepID=A0ABP9A4H3_9MICO
MSTDEPRLDCGRTLEELSDYLESGRSPRDAHIESCPECLNALDTLEGAGRLSRALVAVDASTLPEPPESWFQGILGAIALELRAGRDLPLHHPDPRVDLSITEGAVHALLRTAGDGVDGVFIGRTAIDGDAETPGAPVTVRLTASIAWPLDVAAVSEELRARAFAALRQHTELNVTAVDIRVDDIHGYEGGRS